MRQITARRTVRAFFVVTCTAATFAACSSSTPEEATGTARAALSADLVIGQVYGGGGNANASYTNDFVELFNRGSAAVSLAGMSIEYGADTGAFSKVTTLPSVSVQPGQYFLVGMASSGAVGAALPTPDATGTTNLAANAGKVALVNGTTALSCDAGACDLTNVVDLVGYGTSSTTFEGSGPAKAASSNNAVSVQRKGAGCVETDDNAADFANPVLAVTPRYTGSPLNVCGADAGDAGDAGDDGGGGGGPIDAGSDGADDAAAADDGASGADGDDGAVSDDAGGDGATSDDAGASDDGGAADDGGTVDDGGATDAGAGDGAATDDGGAAADAGAEAGTDAGPLDATGLVISQVYGAGGNANATYANDFVELFNRGNAAVSLAGLSVQYASSTGTFNTNSLTALPSATVPPGRYFLLQLASSGAVGAALPAPDATNNGVNLSASNGKIALAYGTTPLGCGGPDAGACPSSSVVDLVGYGAGATAFEGTGPATAASNAASSVQRLGGGCVDTDDNAKDFAKPEPAVSARNSGTGFNDCTAGGIDAGGPGTTPDAGSGAHDAGGGGIDAGASADAGTNVDAGTKLDAGAHDAAVRLDASATGNGETGDESGAGCSCRAAGAGPTRGPAPLLGGLGLVAVLAAASRRRGSRGRRG